MPTGSRCFGTFSDGRTPGGGHNLRPVGARRRKYAVVPGQVRAGFRHQRGAWLIDTCRSGLIRSFNVQDERYPGGKHMRRVFSILLLLFAGQAGALTIDFTGDIDSYTTDTGYSVYRTQGFEFEVLQPSGRVFNEAPIINGPPYCCGSASMYTESGEASALESVYFSEVPFILVGHLVSGGTITTSVNAIGGILVNFDDQWANLSRVDFAADTGVSLFGLVDDVTVSVVPVPASVWLFARHLPRLASVSERLTPGNQLAAVNFETGKL